MPRNKCPYPQVMDRKTGKCITDLRKVFKKGDKVKYSLTFETDEMGFERLIPPKHYEKKNSKYLVTRKWEGKVTEVRDDIIHVDWDKVDGDKTYTRHQAHWDFEIEGGKTPLGLKSPIKKVR